MWDIAYRSDGRIEIICPCGVGHTAYNPNDWGRWTYSHGCCGKSCCMRKEFIELANKVKTK